MTNLWLAALTVAAGMSLVLAWMVWREQTKLTRLMERLEKRQGAVERDVEQLKRWQETHGEALQQQEEQQMQAKLNALEGLNNLLTYGGELPRK